MPMLATALEQFAAGDLPAAEAICRTLLAADPAHAGAGELLARIHTRRGDEALGAGDAPAAVAAYTAALGLAPGGFRARGNRGIAFARLGRHAEARADLEAALRLQPGSEPVLTTLAGCLQALGEVAAAEAMARRAVAADPALPEPWTSLGAALHATGQLAAAADAYRQALAIAPGHALATYNLGQVLNDQWQVTAARQLFRRAVELDPGYAPAWHTHLLMSLYDPAESGAAVRATHAAWGEHVTRQLGPGEPAPLDPAWSRRRLRVGYVSPDFRRQSCAYFLKPLFAAHDRDAVEVFAYSAVTRPDEETAWFRDSADHWRDLRGLGLAAAAAQVRRDGIDVLVDLGGHTRDQPLALFALAPAPAQVAWLGYPATTGLPQVGYRLTDAVTDPPGDADREFVERLVRLPGPALCYSPPADAPAVATLPATQRGAITFGSFNNLAKLTPEAIGAWAAILAAVPGSRLLLKARALRAAEARAAVAAAFSTHGIDAGRIGMRGWEPAVAGSLALYGQVDIALDTFPYNGTTTTFEALWMGVPVVALRGARHAARVGAAILTAVGQADWVADDIDHYVAIARRLAADVPALAIARRELRARLARSPLMDAAGFARRVEAAYREILAGEAARRGLLPLEPGG